MKTKPTIIVLAVIVLAGLFAVRAMREAERTRASIRELASQRAGLLAKIAIVEQQLQTAHHALARLDGKIGPPPEGPRASAGANTVAAGNASVAKPVTPVRRLNAGGTIANDPKKLAEYARNFRASLDFTYGGMFKALGLSAAQVEKFKDLKVWLEEQRMDLNAAIEMQSADSERIKRYMASPRAMNDFTVLTPDWNSQAGLGPLSDEWHKTRVAKEAELLGDLNAPYREHYLNRDVRILSLELAGTAVYSGEPVTSAQIERTTRVLAANSQRGESGAARGHVRYNTVNWDTASVQLQGVLSPAQVAALGDIVQQHAMQAKVVDLRRRLTAQFKGQPPPK